MSTLIDLCGMEFGKLVVASRADNLHNRTAWNCVCDCGNSKVVTSSDLKCRKVTSCGCYRLEITARNGKLNISHGMAGTRIWDIWSGMRNRCKFHERYISKGIKVCDEWQMFEPFRDWALANGYADNLTIDRRDNDKGYSPDNCRWATYKVQNNNKSTNRIIDICGCVKTVSEWAEFVGISSATLLLRLNADWPKKDLFIPPKYSNSKIRKER